MPPSNKNINVRHGTNAHRVRARYQSARSNSPEKRPDIERRTSRSEDIEMTNGSSAANRFALLPHTEPAPGLDSEQRGVRPPQSEFTFLHELQYPPAARTAAPSESRHAFPSEANSKIPQAKSERITSSTRQADKNLYSLKTAASRTPTPRSQHSKHFQPPATPPQTPPLEPSPTSECSPIQTVTLSPEYINLLSSSSTPPLHPSLPSPSPQTTAPPSRPQHHPPLKKPIVHLPPTKPLQNPNHHSKPPSLPPPFPSLPSDLQSQPQPTTAAEIKLLAMAAEIAAATYAESSKAKMAEPARRFGAKRGLVCRVHSDGGRGGKDKGKEEGVGEEQGESEGGGWEDEEGGSDSEWEFIA